MIALAWAAWHLIAIVVGVLTILSAAAAWWYQTPTTWWLAVPTALLGVDVACTATKRLRAIVRAWRAIKDVP